MARCKGWKTMKKPYERHIPHVKGFKYSTKGCMDCDGAVIVKKRGQDKAHTLYSCDCCGKEYRAGDRVKLGNFKRRDSA